MNSKVYKWCSVPQCTNTSIKTPNKLFIFVPHKKTTRDKWLKLARRDLTRILPNTLLYFCEDHFDLPNDMENYMQYHLMGSVSQIRMKQGCVPTKFYCQHNKRKYTSNTTDQKYIHKKQRKMSIEECKKVIEGKSIIDTKQLENGETSFGKSEMSTTTAISTFISPNLCRCCHSFGFYTDISADDPERKETYEDILKETFNIQISSINKGSVQPSNQICDECINKLQEAYAFRNMVIANESKMLEHFETDQSENFNTIKEFEYTIIKSEIDVKEECVNEEYIEKETFDFDTNEVPRQKLRLCVPPHNTQFLENSAESGNQSVLTLDMNIKEEAEHDIEGVIESRSKEIASNKLQGIESSLNFIKPKHFDSQKPPNKIRCDNNMTFEEEKEKPRESQKYHQATMQPEILMLSMHYVICAFFKESRENIDFEQLMSFSKTIFTHERCEMVQKATVGRCESTHWCNMRYGRVMASQAYDAAHCLQVGSLADQIIAAQMLTKTQTAERGESHELSIRNVVAKLKNIQIKKPSLVISPDFPFFGASPDKSQNNEEDYWSKVLERRGERSILRENSLRLLENSTMFPFQYNKCRYLCLICKEHFIEMAALRNHNLSHSEENLEKIILRQSQTMVKVEISILICKKCDENFENLDDLRVHLTEKHSINFPIKENLLIPYKIENEGLKCQICSELFDNFRILSMHVNKHYKNHICDVCGHSYSNLVFLNLHKTRAHKKHICTECDINFETGIDKKKHDIDKHNVIIEKKLRFVCSYCNDRFSQENLKIQHLVDKHGLRKPDYKCPFCSKAFITKSLRNNHMKNVHMKEKKHECDVCNNFFYTKSDLMRHRVTHTGEKKFSCALCSTLFATKDSLRRHVKRSHN